MTGKTVEEAVEAALDQLGVAENDAEIVIVEEPKSGMFGLRRSGARIRARVRPFNPGRRDRHAGRERRQVEASAATAASPSVLRAPRASRPRRSTVRKDEAKVSQVLLRNAPRPIPSGPGTRSEWFEKDTFPGVHEAAEATEVSAEVGGTPPASGRQRSRSRGRGGRGRATSSSDGIADESSSGAGRGTVSSKEAQMSIETQQELATDFVREVVARFVSTPPRVHVAPKTTVSTSA